MVCVCVRCRVHWTLSTVVHGTPAGNRPWGSPDDVRELCFKLGSLRVQSIYVLHHGLRRCCKVCQDGSWHLLSPESALRNASLSRGIVLAMDNEKARKSLIYKVDVGPFKRDNRHIRILVAMDSIASAVLSAPVVPRLCCTPFVEHSQRPVSPIGEHREEHEEKLCNGSVMFLLFHQSSR